MEQNNTLRAERADHVIEIRTLQIQLAMSESAEVVTATKLEAMTSERDAAVARAEKAEFVITRLRSKLRDKCEELSYHALSCANCNMSDQLRGMLGSHIEYERRRAELAEEALRVCRAEIADFQRLSHGKKQFPDTRGMEMADAVLAAAPKDTLHDS